MRHQLATLLVAITAMLLASCASEPPPRVGTYVVRSGDTVSGIALRYRVDYRELARVNGIGGDYLIFPGQVLRIPRAGSARSAPSVAARSTPVMPATPVPGTPPTPAVAVTPVPNAFPPSLPTLWIPPADLQRATFVTRPTGSVGLSFAGSEDQDILAAADGKVIYTGVGALGYGLLIIIKHTETCLSAYGYTRSLKVSEGDDVKAGQPIATMGYEPQGNVALYFEIRLSGRTTDPRPLLTAAPSPVTATSPGMSPVTTTPLTD